jgi:hypothetical protein
LGSLNKEINMKSPFIKKLIDIFNFGGSLLAVLITVLQPYSLVIDPVGKTASEALDFQEFD